MSSNELVRQESQAVAESATLLQVIANAVADPRCDVEKMERLLAMQERVMADQRRVEFFAAMGRLTDKLPPIQKRGQSHHGAYARLEDIDREIRPLLAGEGFSLSFDSVPAEGKVRVSCTLRHSAGHSETKTIDLPLDTSGSKNGAQSVISTVSYGRRALTKMFFNLVEAGEDTDGNPNETVNDEQQKTIQSLIEETKSDKAKFLKLIAGVPSIAEIPARDYRRVVTALEEKQRATK